jgi:lipopolysaccharide export system permease protein
MILHFKEQMVRIDLSSLKAQSTDEQLFKNHAEMMNVNQLRMYKDTAILARLNTYNTTYDQFVNQYYFQKSLAQFKAIEKDTSFLSVANYLETLKPAKRKATFENALNLANSAKSFIDSRVNEETGQIESQADYDVELHEKFTLSITCIILFFVGAPLGAIVRKGGFGMPVIISVFLFITYYVISISLKKMVLQNKLIVVAGMWTTPLVFLPLGIWLTRKAANDSPLFDITIYKDFFTKLFSKFKPRNANSAA